MEATLKWQLICMYRQMENTTELVKVLRQLGEGRLSRRAQTLFLAQVVHDKVAIQYPPDKAYTARLLKLVILAAEKDALRGDAEDSAEEEEPVLEALYAEHVKQMETVSRMDESDGFEAKWCYRTYAYTTPREASARANPSQLAFSVGVTTAQPSNEPHLSGPEDASFSYSNGSFEETNGAADHNGRVFDRVSENLVRDSGYEQTGLSTTARSSDLADNQHAAKAPLKQDSVDQQIGSNVDPGLAQLVTVRVSLNLFEGGTGCTTWSAGFCLAEFALSHPEFFPGKRVLELGAGAGVLGVVMARLPGIREVILTDGNEETLENLERNLRLNGVETARNGNEEAFISPTKAGELGTGLSRRVVANRGINLITGFVNGRGEKAETGSADLNGVDAVKGTGRPESEEAQNLKEPVSNGHVTALGRPTVRCERLDWEDVSDAQLQAYDADVILGADVLYDPGVISDLVRILLVVLATRGSASEGCEKDTSVNEGVSTQGSSRSLRKEAYIATALRNESTLDSFVTAVEKAGLLIELVDPCERRDSFQYCEWMKRDRIRLHRISP